jgi:hypothetical protein
LNNLQNNWYLLRNKILTRGSANQKYFNKVLYRTPANPQELITGSNQFKQSRSWKIEKSWTCWKFWKKKIPIIFSLWAHQMKIVEDHIVFIKIFCCSKLKNCSLSSLSKSKFQTFKPFKQFDCLNGLKLVVSLQFSLQILSSDKYFVSRTLQATNYDKSILTSLGLYYYWKKLWFFLLLVRPCFMLHVNFKNFEIIFW